MRYLFLLPAKYPPLSLLKRARPGGARFDEQLRDAT